MWPKIIWIYHTVYLILILYIKVWVFFLTLHTESTVHDLDLIETLMSVSNWVQYSWIVEQWWPQGAGSSAGCWKCDIVSWCIFPMGKSCWWRVWTLGGPPCVCKISLIKCSRNVSCVVMNVLCILKVERVCGSDCNYIWIGRSIFSIEEFVGSICW